MDVNGHHRGSVDDSRFSQPHEEFELLCALSASGELEPEEQERLENHLQGCAACRDAKEAFERLAVGVMPILAADGFESSSPSGLAEMDRLQMEAAARHLMARLDEHSQESTKPEPGRRPATWVVLTGTLAAMLIAGLTLALILVVHQKPPAQKALSSPNGLPNSPASLSPPAARPLVSSSTPPQPSQQAIVELQKKLTTEAGANERLKQQVANLSEQAAALQSSLQEANTDRAQSAANASKLQDQLQSVQTQLASLQTESTRGHQQIAQLEDQLESRTSEAEQKDRLLAEDTDLLSHDRDIRDLIGARNLYIAEIYDVAQTGATKKPFGRIFYTKDKSLVFYGYDLDQQPDLKEPVAFQAWGSGDGKENVNLGLFYRDGTQRRWILRFNDAKTLARLNSIFVTVEPKGGSSKPTGKPLLVTYLRLEPNHP